MYICYICAHVALHIHTHIRTYIIFAYIHLGKCLSNLLLYTFYLSVLPSNNNNKNKHMRAYFTNSAMARNKYYKKQQQILDRN